jgi:hypothetical protein
MAEAVALSQRTSQLQQQLEDQQVRWQG